MLDSTLTALVVCCLVAWMIIGSGNCDKWYTSALAVFGAGIGTFLLVLLTKDMIKDTKSGMGYKQHHMGGQFANFSGGGAHTHEEGGMAHGDEVTAGSVLSSVKSN